MPYYLVIITLMFVSLTAHSQSISFKTPAHACAFKKPFVFGASNSSGYSGIMDGIEGKINAFFGKSSAGRQATSFDMITARYYPKNNQINVAEIVGDMKHRSYGHRQLFSYIKQSKSNFESLKRSTVIASLDAFYWPAVNGDCEEAAEGAEKIIDLGAKLQIPVILANVPQDDPGFVTPFIKKRWSPPQPRCVNMINSVLANSCKAERGCYLIDAHNIIKHLNSDGIKFAGHVNKTFDFRFDGVHLSEKGFAFVAGYIEHIMSQNPPRCN